MSSFNFTCTCGQSTQVDDIHDAINCICGRFWRRYKDTDEFQLSAPINDELTFEALKNKPEQYEIGIDTFERMRANASYEEAMGFIRWNIDKYNTRQKNQDKSDYTKIKAYCDEALWWIENRSE